MNFRKGKLTRVLVRAYCSKDRCSQEKPLDCVGLSDSCDPPMFLHICRECASVYYHNRETPYEEWEADTRTGY